MAHVKINDDLETLFGAWDDFNENPLDVRLLSNGLYRATFGFDGSEFTLRADIDLDDPAEPTVESFTLLSPYGTDLLVVSDLRATTDRLSSGLDVLLSGSDQIEGSARGDQLWGYGGNDTILGGAGADRLSGGAGSDRLLGGRGADRLDGGQGQDRLNAGLDEAMDTFVLRSVGHSAVGARHDVLLNFDRGEDLIDLRALDPRPGSDADDPFVWGGRTPGDRHVWWVATENGVLLRGDLGGDGDSRADFEIMIRGLGSLSQADVLL